MICKLYKNTAHSGVGHAANFSKRRGPAFEGDGGPGAQGEDDQHRSEPLHSSWRSDNSGVVLTH